MFTLSGILRRANRNSKPNAPRRQARLRPEALEDRCVLSTRLVTSNADDFTAQPGTLRYAVENAASGDTISISRALTNTPIVLNPFLGELLINKDLAIEADANAPATIQAAAPLGLTGSRVFEITGGAHVTLSHLTLTNGHGSFGSFTAVVGGGAIYNAGILTVSDCTLSGNTADAFVAYPGGAILNSGGTITITHSTLSSNGGSRGGAIANYSGTITINNSLLSENSAGIDLGAGLGGAIANFSGTVVITDTDLSGNTCSGFGFFFMGLGGGIYNSGSLTITNSKLFDNGAVFEANGGGVYNSSGDVTITNSTLTGNFANIGDGGGIYNDSGTVRLTNSSLSGNFTRPFGGEGGGIYNASGTVTITSCILSGNSATSGLIGGGNGGGIYNSSGTVAITNSDLFDNSAANDGGGIYNAGTLTVKNSTIQGNTAPPGDGADLFMAGGTLNRKNSVIGVINP